MNSQETIEKIQEFISKGQTEEAIAAMIALARASDTPLEEDALLLSSQYQKWKKESILGLEHSSHELRRIEVSILELLNDEQIPKNLEVPINMDEIVALGKNDPEIADFRLQAQPKKQNWIPLIGGVLAIIAAAAVIWVMLGRENTSTTPDQATNTNQSQAPSSEPSQGTHFTKLTVVPDMELIKGNRYPTADNRFFLILQEDGNLCVRKNEGKESDGTFKWGSYQESGIFATHAHFHADGNLYLKNDTSDTSWSTNIHDNGVHLGVTDQGVLIVLNVKDQIIWQGATN